MKSFPWDAIVEGLDEETGFPIYDRQYDAKDFRDVLRRFFSNGIFADDPTGFNVKAGVGMTVTVDSGYCLINGTTGIEDKTRTLMLQEPDTVYSRIDTVVLRWDTDIDERSIDLYILEGIPAEIPERPELTRIENTVWELGLCDILVPAGSVTVADNRITDTRLETERCGIVMPFAEFDSTSFFERINVLLENLYKENEEYVIAEAQRKENELQREANEQERVSNESQRVTDEKKRLENEEDRVTSEVERKANESKRENNENTRMADEASRTNKWNEILEKWNELIAGTSADIDALSISEIEEAFAGEEVGDLVSLVKQVNELMAEIAKASNLIKVQMTTVSMTVDANSLVFQNYTPIPIEGYNPIGVIEVVVGNTSSCVPVRWTVSSVGLRNLGTSQADANVNVKVLYLKNI